MGLDQNHERHLPCVYLLIQELLISEVCRQAVLPLELPIAFLLCKVLALTHSAFPPGIPKPKRETFLNYSVQRAECFGFVFPLSESVKL